MYPMPSPQPPDDFAANLRREAAALGIIPPLNPLQEAQGPRPGNFLEMARPQPTYRAYMLPYAEYDDGSAGFSYPQIVPDTWNAMRKLGHAAESAFGGAEYAPKDVMPTAHDVALLAGLAMTGGLAVPRPTSALASGLTWDTRGMLVPGALREMAKEQVRPVIETPSVRRLTDLSHMEMEYPKQLDSRGLKDPARAENYVNALAQIINEELWPESATLHVNRANPAPMAMAGRQDGSNQVSRPMNFLETVAQNPRGWGSAPSQGLPGRSVENPENFLAMQARLGRDFRNQALGALDPGIGPAARTGEALATGDYGTVAMEAPFLAMAMLPGIKPKGIRAFHSSPHNFDRFDASHANPGQTYAQGLHFAGDERDTMNFRPDEGGRTYEVMLKASPEDFIEMTEPISAQSAKVQEALRASGFRDEPNRSDPSKPGNIDDAWRALRGGPGRYSDQSARDKKISRDLAKAGIPGVRYGRRDQHYVVFPGNEHLIEIVKKYGIAGAAALLGMSQADLADAMESPQ